jgi:Alginate lyase
MIRFLFLQARWYKRLGFFIFSITVSAHAADPAGALAATNQSAIEPAAPTNTDFDAAAFDRDRILKVAMSALTAEPITITKYHSPLSQGGTNDFYSQGDSWFPDANSADGMPYKQHPGEVNPNNFNDHKRCLSKMRDNVAALAAAYKITGNSRYATVAAEWLRVFFVDPETRMNPNLDYAEAVPGVAKGRSIGVSDVVPLVEIPSAVAVLQQSPNFPPAVLAGLKDWSTNFIGWMTGATGSTNGDDVAEQGSAHSVAYWLELTAFAKFIGDEDQVAKCRSRYKIFLLSGQTGPDGAIARAPKVRSYSTSLCIVDNLAIMCQLLSTPDDNLWNFTSSDGRNIRKSIDYIEPYIENKSRWPKPIDTTEAQWPSRQACLLFAGIVYEEPDYIELWKKLPPDPSNDEVRRYFAVTQPVLWLK